MTETAAKSPNFIKYATPALVLAAVAAVILIASRNPDKSQEEGIFLRGGAIVVTKPDATLREIAQALDDPSVFSYDENRNAARANLHLWILEKGSLRIGGESEEDREILEFNTNSCGDASLRIGPDAALYITNSEVATSHRTISARICTRGYTVFSEGRIEARDSRFHFISGTQSEFFRGDASGFLDNVEIYYSDGVSLRMVDVDGKRIAIRNSRFETAAQYGLAVFGTSASPIRIEDSVCIGQTADVFLSSGSSDVVLVDCEFRKNRVSFANARGLVSINWRARVKVVRGEEPLAGALVAATAGGSVVEGITDEQGIAVLELTEQIVSAAGVEMVTPHSFSASIDGQVAARTGPLPIHAKADDLGEITLAVQ